MVLNYIWIAFFLVAFAIALVRLIFMGDTEIFPAIMDSTFATAKTAFEISLGLTGVLSLWMGIMKIGENGGIVNVVARMLAPVFSKIFPDIPKGHPVTGTMFMNFAANMLGLDNAATPMGLKAMQELQTLNDKKDTATNPMIMFLVLNTSGLTLIPMSVLLVLVVGKLQCIIPEKLKQRDDLHALLCRIRDELVCPGIRLPSHLHENIGRGYFGAVLNSGLIAVHIASALHNETEADTLRVLYYVTYPVVLRKNCAHNPYFSLLFFTARTRDKGRQHQRKAEKKRYYSFHILSLRALYAHSVKHRLFFVYFKGASQRHRTEYASRLLIVHVIDASAFYALHMQVGGALLAVHVSVKKPSASLFGALLKRSLTHQHIYVTVHRTFTDRSVRADLAHDVVNRKISVAVGAQVIKKYFSLTRQIFFHFFTFSCNLRIIRKLLYNTIPLLSRENFKKQGESMTKT